LGVPPPASRQSQAHRSPIGGGEGALVQIGTLPWKFTIKARGGAQSQFARTPPHAVPTHSDDPSPSPLWTPRHSHLSRPEQRVLVYPDIHPPGKNLTRTPQKNQADWIWA
jgi:hypothetical protein